ncbi:MAG: hypothetical protein AB7R89_07295 [Dehalococcoidia bacterium]
MFTHPDTRLEEVRLQREIALRRAALRARLGPLPDSPHRARRTIGTPAAWFRRMVDQFRARRTPQPRLRG